MTPAARWSTLHADADTKLCGSAASVVFCFFFYEWNTVIYSGVVHCEAYEGVGL